MKNLGSASLPLRDAATMGKGARNPGILEQLGPEVSRWDLSLLAMWTSIGAALKFVPGVALYFALESKVRKDN